MNHKLHAPVSGAGNKAGPGPPRICYNCQGAKGDHRFAKLWDGNLFCLNCIEEICPEILPYREKHAELEESLPHSAWQVAWSWFGFFMGGIVITFGALAFYTGCEKAGFAGGVSSFLTIIAFCTPLVLVFTLAATAGFVMHRPTVSLKNGQLQIRTGDRFFERVPLSKCEWNVGRISYTTAGKNEAPCRGTAVLIAYPTERGPEKERIASVGFTEETKRIWAGLLTLSGLPRRTACENLNPWSAVNFLGTAVLIWTVIAGLILVPFARAFVLSLTNDKEIAKLIGAQIWLPISFFVAAYVAHFWPWDCRPRVPSRHAPKEKRKIVRDCVLVCASTQMLIVVPFIMSTRFRLESQIVGASFGFVIAVLVGYDLGQRLAAWKRQTIIKE